MEDKQIVALVTCYFQHNYGSQLQAFATQLAFDRLGIKNETICIDGLLPEINKAKYKYFLSRIFDFETIKDKMATARKILAKKCNQQYAANLLKRYKMFDEFANTRFVLSRRYNSKADLMAAAQKYSAFVVGSDQLWLPSNIAADYYTLNFVPEEIPKVALATSFGISSLSKKYGEKAARFLKRINHVSVRETSGQQIVKQWANLEVPVVCDPTIMFSAEDWMTALNIVDKGNEFPYNQGYIFVYFLGNNLWQRDLVRKISQQMKLKIVQIAHNDEYIKTDENFANYTPYDVGCKEFVELVKNAEFVFTDSFHCTAFSMLFHKTFFSFPRYSNNGSTSTNGRLYSLLSLVKQESRMIEHKDIDNFDFFMPIDYQMVDTELDGLRSFTWKWLKDALKDCNVYDRD